MFAEGLLRHWIGAELATHGALVLSILALAAWIESLSNLPSLVNDGLGHPRVTGVFALLHAVLALGLIVILVRSMGITGAALGHFVVSAVMGTIFMLYVHGRTVPVRLRTVLLKAYVPSGLLVGVAAVPAWFLRPFASQGLVALLASGALIAALLGVLGFAFILEQPHRQRLIAWVRKT